MAILDPITKSMTSEERVPKSVLIMCYTPKALHAYLGNKVLFLNIQNGHQAAILDPITNLLKPDERVTKSVLSMY